MLSEDRDLVKQLLLAKRSYVVGGHTKHEWVNPDGPTATALIEVLDAEIERLNAMLTAATYEAKAMMEEIKRLGGGMGISLKDLS